MHCYCRRPRPSATGRGGCEFAEPAPRKMGFEFWPATWESPTGWNEIPGARGCTPQSCAFRDHFDELKRAGAAQVFGVSTQGTADQREAVERLHLPFELLSDEKLALARALKLPTFGVDGMTLIRRITLIAREGVIEKVFYPVFPPDRNAGDVLAWLAGR